MTVTYHAVRRRCVERRFADHRAADFECTWQASLNTPESISTAGYDQIIVGHEPAHPTRSRRRLRSAVTRRTRRCSTRSSRPSQYADCNDVIGRLQAAPTRTPANAYIDDRVDARADRVRGQPGVRRPEVPKTDRRSSSSPPRTPRRCSSPARSTSSSRRATPASTQSWPTRTSTSPPRAAASYEGLYFQQDDDCMPDETRSCAFADDDFRAGVLEVDRHRRRVRPDLRAVRAGSAAADLRPDRSRPVLRRHGLRADTYDPAGAERS